MEMNNNSKYFIGYLDKVIKSLVLILPKMSGYVKTFKDANGNKDNTFISFCIDDENLLEKYKTSWTKIENLKNLMLLLFLIIDLKKLK